MFKLFISDAFAAGATAATAQPAFMQFAPIALIVGIFYFVMIRPHKKALEDEQKIITELTKGEEIFTKSGLLGTVTGITDKIITLEVSEGVKLKVLKSQIGGLAKVIFEKKKEEK